MVELVPMTLAEFAPYLDRTLGEYARENVAAGRWTESEAVSEARKQLDGLLPAGLDTPNQYLFNIVADRVGEKVGMVWFAIEPRGAFVYDLRVFEPFRRRGYAEEAMRALEGLARARGAEKISLHVFGPNRGARNLYEKLGYGETNVMMSKPLVP